jgi:glucokinase
MLPRNTNCSILCTMNSHKEKSIQIVVGIDIGGTKCAVSFGRYADNAMHILETLIRPTITDNFSACLGMIIDMIGSTLAEHPEWELGALGITCGGPLDSRTGRILAPPNLSLWDNVDIVTPLKNAFSKPVSLQNDADACALAEWEMGAGKGTAHMIFLTFGTGMGAGLILNGQLYTGSTNLAGEVGHIRLAETGPEGHGKPGSFEGFCSGGGIAKLGRIEARKALVAGIKPLFCPEAASLETIDARKIAEALEAGDETAAAVYRIAAKYLGRGLSILIDILNPELIVLGGIYGRQQAVLENCMREEIFREALPQTAGSCRIEPAGLGEKLGSYASLSVALYALKEKTTV